MYFRGSLNDISFTFAPKIKLSINDNHIVEQNWRYQKVKNNRLFNGLGYGLLDYKIIDDKFHFTICKTSYKKTRAAIDIKLCKPGLMRLSVGVIICSKDKLFLVRRSNTVCDEVGKLTCIVGGIDFDKKVTEHNFKLHILNEALKELKEEVLLDKPVNGSDLEYFATGLDNTTWSLSFYFTLKNRCPVKVISDENDALVEINSNKIYDYLDSIPKDFIELFSCLYKTDITKRIF